jgi:small redox-active disulfide protein 2
MEIRVLGTGCPKCRKLYDEVVRAVAAAGVAADVAKVESIPEILAYDVMITPALVIDGKVRAAGRVPSAAELATWIRDAART